MTADERSPLPESAGSLFDAAARAYGRRLWLYLGLALFALAIQATSKHLLPKDQGVELALNVILDAFIAAAVSIGVVSDLGPATTRPPTSAVLSAALERWWIVAGTSVLLQFITATLQSGLVAPVDSLSYFLMGPIVVALGSLNFATVIGALDRKSSPELLVLSSIGRSMMLAFARPNIGRLVVLSIVAAVPIFLQLVLADQLQIRKVASAEFLGNVSIDALVTGPLQALFTVFYLDFVRRAAQPVR
jgi:hypothetical protein